MLASTILAIPFVPVFYVIMQGLSERRARGKVVAPDSGGKPDPAEKP